MKKLIIALVCLLISSPAHAVVYCKRFPSDTPVACYGPDYPPPAGSSQWFTNSGVGIGTYDNVGIGTNVPYGLLHLYSNSATKAALVFGNGAADNLKVFNSPVNFLSPSYTNPGGTGSRQSSITTTTTLTMDPSYNDITKLVNGLIVTGEIVFDVQAVAGLYIRFDFGVGTSYAINEAKWYQSAGTSGGTWKWQGSNNAVAWSDIGSSFTLANGSATQTQTELSSNITGYRYYQLLGVSGNASAGPWIEEIEFKIGDAGSGVSTTQFQEYTGGTTAGGIISLQPTAGNVGIGTLVVPNKLYVAGTTETQGFKLPLNPTAGYVLTSNTVGVGTWMPAASGSGSGTVNSGVATFYGQYPSTGTTIDDSAVTMDDGTNVGIGTITPSAKLTISTSAVQDLLRINDDGIADTTPLVVDQTGNVGIGSASPSAALAISSTAAQDLFRIDDNGTGDLSPFVVDLNGNVGIGTSLTQTDKLLVMSGNVGIGTWIPSTALDVKGTIVASTDIKIGANSVCQSNGVNCPAGGTSQWITTASVGIGTYDNVGIGTTQPQAALAIASGNVGIGTFTSTNQRLTVMGGNVGIGTFLGNHAFAVMNGSVGIGTWNPAADLEVSGANGILSRNGATTGTLAGNNLTFSASAAGVSNSSNNAAAAMTITGSAATNGALTLRSTSGNGTDDYIDFVSGNAGGTKSIRISSGGNVGIGTVAPSSLLQINAIATPVLISSGSLVGLGTSVLNNRLSVNGGVGIGDTYAGVVVPTGQLAVKSNLGVGTYAPRQVLEVTGSGLISTNLGIGTTVLNNSLAVNGGLAVGDTYAGVVIPTGQLGVKLNVGIGTYAPRQTLEANGSALVNTNLGIGTTVLNNRLAVNGGASIGDTYAGVIVPVGQLSVKSNVGIGTYAPRQFLEVSGSGIITTNLGIGTVANQAALSVMSGNVGIGTWAPIGAFQVGGTGNVGIGTTNPGASLDIFGSAGSARVRVVGIGTTVPQAVCMKADGTLGYYTTTTFAGTCL